MSALMHAIEAEDFQAIARLLAVLADPTRLMLLYLLKQSPGYVQDLVDRSGLKQSNVSKHLAMLYDAGLVSRQRNGNFIRYAVSDPLVFDLCKLCCAKLDRQARDQADMVHKVSRTSP
jgi:DNA-binding transcriptional ArsR family regulator